MNSLIEALSEDNISLLCATRPAVVKIMGSLEPYLMERIELKGLNLIEIDEFCKELFSCLLYTSPSPRDRTRSRMPSSA